MSADLKAVLRGQKASKASGGKVKVLVALATATADRVLLDRLEHLGLQVDRVVGNKIIGAVPPDRLEDLRRDPAVSEVEESVTLERH